MSDESERNKQIVRDITEQIWNQRRFDASPKFYAEDYVVDYRPYVPMRHGHAAVRDMVERACAAFQDYHDELHDLIAEGDTVVARLTISGTQKGLWGALPPTGKHASFEEMVMLKFRDGKVVWQRGVVDNLGALRQLGVIPTPK
jgi:predicted ester cyclase